MIYNLDIAIAELQRHRVEQDHLKELRKKLPREQFDAIIKQLKKKHKRDAKHQRKLAIAREGRSLNFWGNR